MTLLGEHPPANCHVEAMQFARGVAQTWCKENLLGWSIPKPFPSITSYFSTATTLTICQTEHLEMHRTNGFSSFLYSWKTSFNYWDYGHTRHPSPHESNPDQQQSNPPEPPQSTPTHSYLRALLLWIRVARGGPERGHTTDNQESHPKEPNARIMQPICPNGL